MSKLIFYGLLIWFIYWIYQQVSHQTIGNPKKTNRNSSKQKYDSVDAEFTDINDTK